jgi:ribonuclease-3
VADGRSRRTDRNHPLAAALSWATRYLQHEFDDPALLQQALTHRSAASKPDNERLEFLGDAFLNFVIAEALYAGQPGYSEGDLTKLRATLVRGSTLAEVALELGVDQHVILGAGDLKTGGAQRTSTLANALEAVLGAVLLDSDPATARKVVLRLFTARMARLPDPAELKDPKTRLQEWLQARRRALPVYEMTAVTGAQHNQHFTVECRISEEDAATSGTGNSRRQAEQQAAQHMLDRLQGDADTHV